MSKWFLPIFAGVLLLLAAGGAYAAGEGFLPRAYYRAMEEASVLDFSEAEAIEQAEEPPVETDGAVHVLLDGIAICAVETEDVAAAVLNARLSAYAEAPEGERLSAVRFARLVSLAPATGEFAALSGAEFEALLAENPALLAIEQVSLQTIDTAIPYAVKTAEEEDDRLPEGARIVDGGRPGLSRKVTEITRINGTEVGRETLEEGVLMEPVDALITLGGYESSRPEREPGRSEGEDGPELAIELQRPIQGESIDSNFGTRTGRMHYGVDYAAEAGTPVLAPAAGVVLFAGERGAYGGVVDLDHGNGLVSRLARLDAIAVAVGDTVAAGQEIAKVLEPDDPEIEPRLHFETLVDGIPHNPRQYLD